MRIYSMTATFGKLENQTLTLEPGLNIISAPNEWGKSTWCAFLVAMLYGIDTGARSKKASIADKEHYAPWSGAPMSGRMAISWNGRDITIERRAKGRIPMGDFSAYETATGLPVAELTAANCGQALLGVERSVFQRAGFISLSDLPVTQDESLRRRLNALVTTGDESGKADDLAQKLKDLKNKCRFNRSGLLPQAEEQREQLQQKLDRLHRLLQDCQTIRQIQQEQGAELRRLENHLLTMNYQKAVEEHLRFRRDQELLKGAEEKLAQMQAACEGLPAQEPARQKLDSLNALQQEQLALQTQAQSLPRAPEKPLPPPRYAYTPPEQAVQEAQKDLDFVKAQEQVKTQNSRLMWIYAAAAAVLLLLLLVPGVRPFALYIGLAVALGGIAAAVLCGRRTDKMRQNLQRVYDMHPGLGVDKWLPEARSYADSHAAYLRDLEAVRGANEGWNSRKELLSSRLAAETEGQPLSQAIAYYTKVLERWAALAEAKRELEFRIYQVESVQKILKPLPPAPEPDDLYISEKQTREEITHGNELLQKMDIQLGQCQGEMHTLGSEASLQAQLDAVNARIGRLTQTYNALEIAMNTLAAAGSQLQRRFAPRISGQAQEIFSRLTDGRYKRLTLSEDLTVSAGGEDEVTLRSALWRSEGTVDQLYLSLRLAVARELTPDAPLVLDDAFARFDDTRLARAMEVLREEAQTRQVILFSCQSREKGPL